MAILRSVTFCMAPGSADFALPNLILLRENEGSSIWILKVEVFFLEGPYPWQEWLRNAIDRL